jgi:hypothetical protein
MIPRHYAILFFTLLAASLVMGGVLFHMRDRAHQRLLAGQDSAPTRAPQVAPPEQATLLVASDDNNSIRTQVYSLPLPADAEARARAVLGKLLDLYAASNSTHPVPGGAASVAQVFLLPIAGESPKSTSAKSSAPKAVANPDTGPLLAVINLKGAFVASHPSGLETETLTIESICATLHANLPRVAQVRFLVDGEIHPSLAGHADLTRTYLTSDSESAETVQP